MTLLRWLSFLLGSLTVSQSCPFGFISTVAFLPLTFQQTQKKDTLFHCIAYDYSRANWDGLRDNLRDIPWEDIFKLSASAAASEFCECIQVAIDVNIPLHKYQLKLHSTPWFSAACAAPIVHRNHS